MSRKGDVFILVNPAAGRGRRRARVREYLDLLRRELGAIDPALTQKPGDESALVERALAGGAAVIVAIGGDGTWGAAADCILRARRRDVALGLLPTGTGNDFGKSIGVRHERAGEVVRAIADRRTRLVDAGRVGDRHFLNVVGLGFDIAVIDDAARTPLLRGDALYRFCALRQLFRFPGIEATISAPGRTPERRRLLMLTVSNANYFGGSFHIAPRASLEDGKLDLVAIDDAGPIDRAKLFSVVSKGRHEGVAQVTILQSPSFTIHFEREVRYEADGEVYSSPSPLEIACVPGALRVCTPDAEPAA